MATWKKRLKPFESEYLKAYDEMGQLIAAMTIEEREALWDATRVPNDTNVGWPTYAAARMVRALLPADRAVIRKRPELAGMSERG